MEREPERVRNVTAQLSLRQDDDDDNGRSVIEGLAVPFNEQTRIDNWYEGTFDEEFGRGAFKRTLGMRDVVLMFEHGHHPLVGTIPLGQFTDLSETKRGLEFRAELFDNWLIEPITQALDTPQINGVSIRFRPIRTEIIEAEARTDVPDADVPLHRIEEAELFELGPVIFPAYEGTSVDLRQFGQVDLNDEFVRQRLVAALLGVDASANRVGQPLEPGTASKAGAPAVSSSPTKSHLESSPTARALAQRARLHAMNL